MNRLAIALLLGILPASGFAQGNATPPPATNQCWDEAGGELKDKTAPTIARKTGETQIGRDQSPGTPAAPSGNAAGSGQPKSRNAIRPPGVTEC